jgi:hypothetical protein
VARLERTIRALDDMRIRVVEGAMGEAAAGEPFLGWFDPRRAAARLHALPARENEPLGRNQYEKPRRSVA